MKKIDCKFMEDIVEGYARYDDLYDRGYMEYELVDQVCHGRPNSPLHHNEYDCKDCPYYKIKE